MPFEEYKSRVRIVRDEEVVKKWVDDQSWKTEYVCLNLPEPLRLDNMEAVEKHFRETHKENIIKPVESHTLNGAAARVVAQPRPGAPGPQRLGRPAALPAPDRHGPQPAVRRARPAVLQGQQDPHACLRRAAALPRHDGDAGFRRREAASSITSTRIPSARAANWSKPWRRHPRRRPPQPPEPRRRRRRQPESAAADAGTDRRHRGFALADPSGPRH